MTYLLITSVSGIISILFSLSKPGQELELKLIDCRFRLRGERYEAPELALVVIDKASGEIFGEAPYPRELFATLITGLHKMGARVIGIDFSFESLQSALSDSLFSNAIHQANNVVIGRYFREIFENRAPGSGAEINFLIAEKPAPVADAFVTAGVRAGHLDVSSNELTGQTRDVPLYVKYQDELYPSFSMEIINAYYGLNDLDIIFNNKQIILSPREEKAIHIPVNSHGELQVNYPGSQAAFKKCYSFMNVYHECRKIIAGEQSAPITNSFAGKIVIIGSLIGADVFATPFEIQFPGVLIHATIVDNIIRRQFLREYPVADNIILLVSGIILVLIFVYTRTITRFLYAFSLAGILCLGGFLLFKLFGIIISLSWPIQFIVLASALSGISEYTRTVKTSAVLTARLQQMNQVVRSLSEKNAPGSTMKSYYRLFILAIEEREQCIFPHWLEFRDIRQYHVLPFQPRLAVKNPLRMDISAINKINFEVQKTWQSYFQYIQSGKPGPFIPLDQIKKIGAKIVNNFGLKITFNKLFQLRHKKHPLNLVLSNFDIPWFWAFNTVNERFLCEDFSIGISFASEKELQENQQSVQVKHKLQNSTIKSAVILYGDWQGHSTKQLRYTQSQVQHLHRKIVRRKGVAIVVKEKVNEFIEKLAVEISNENNMRIIHYAGHAITDYLDIGEHDFLKPGLVSETMGFTFPSRPIVFLNACSSGKLPASWDKFDHLSTEFLACGAAACIVTTFDVYEKTAAHFANKFYDYFIDQEMEAGEALRQATNDLKELGTKNNYDPSFDITRFAYCLFGDPTVTF